MDTKLELQLWSANNLNNSNNNNRLLKMCLMDQRSKTIAKLKKILSKRQHTFVERFQILEKYFKISRTKKNFCKKYTKILQKINIPTILKKILNV